MARQGDKTPDARELRKFGVVVGGIFIVLFALWPLVRHGTLHLWPWVVGGPLVTLGLVAPRALTLVHRGWTALGHVLGWINLRIILSAVYFALFVPIGVFRRLMGNDTLGLQKGTSDSYRKESQSLPRDRFDRPF